MYGIYEEQIRELERRSAWADERITKLSAVLDYVSVIEDDALNEWLNNRIRQFDDLKEFYEREIDAFKEKWRQSRPRTDYRPKDNIDLIFEIQVKGYINGELM